ncbi:hypothetical protein N9O61_03360 [Octadecabacter sp.]|nr:hypothetical protein [Octadecabacter sp.]
MSGLRILCMTRDRLGGVDDMRLWSPFWVDRWRSNLSGPVGRRLVAV